MKRLELPALSSGSAKWVNIGSDRVWLSALMSGDLMALQSNIPKSPYLNL